jgi:NADH dehydrogenase
MHDWWAYLVISGAGGTIIYSETPDTLYRQHTGNVSGSNMGMLAQVVRLRMLLSGSFKAWNDKNISLLQACREAGVHKLLHMSALGASTDGPSEYLRSKGAAEALLSAAADDPASSLQLRLFRPSVIYGEDDKFLNLFKDLQRFLPMLAVGGAEARFQPVWVGDVAQAVVNSLLQRQGPGPGLGMIVECAGPQVMTLQQIVQQVGAMAGCRRPVVPLPEAVGLLQAAAMGLMPGEPMMSRDNVLSMRVPNVASGKLPGLRDLGITPQGLELLAPHFQPADPRAH